MSNVYFENFDNWADVQREFRMNEPEPDEVLFAMYDLPDYEGYAEVVYRNGDKFYWASGSHCSCMGLEDQWEPEEYDAETFLGVFNRNHRWSFERYFDEYTQARIVSRVKDFLENKYNGA
jgi:hypothetical protein